MCDWMQLFYLLHFLFYGPSIRLTACVMSFSHGRASQISIFYFTPNLNPDLCISWMTKKFSHCLKPFIRPQELVSFMSELSPITQWLGVSHQPCSTAYTAPYSHSSKAINLPRKVLRIKFSFVLQQKDFAIDQEKFFELFTISFQ